MGNVQGPGGMYVELEDANISCGKSIIGRVFLLLNTVVFSPGLALYLKGKETVQWTLEGRKHVGKKTWIHSRFVLNTFPKDTILPGQYSFPFTIHTPEVFPGSFEYKDVQTEARIAYKLIAKLEGSSGLAPVSIPLSVSQPIFGSLHRESPDRVFPLSSCLCMQKGEVKLNAKVNRDVYFPGRSAKVSCSISTEHSQLEVPVLDVNLMRTIRIRGSGEERRTLREKVTGKTVEIELQARQTDTIVEVVVLKIPDDQTVGQAVTVHGDLIECEYQLSTQLITNGSLMCCTEATEMSGDITVRAVKLEKTPPPTAPTSWDPQVMLHGEFTAAIAAS